MTVKPPKPIFRELNNAECLAFLARHQVGRLGLAHKDRVEIIPIHYVADDLWLYGRAAAGTMLELAAHNPWVAFQADEVRGLFDWESVVAKGAIFVLRADGSDEEQAIYQKGLKLLRKVLPETLTPDDPLPERAILFRIHADELTGRKASAG